MTIRTGSAVGLVAIALAARSPPSIPLLDDVRELVAQGLFDSAAILAQFLASLARSLAIPTDDARLDQIEVAVLLGDAFAGNGEYRRAIGHFEDALLLIQISRSSSSSSSSSSDVMDGMIRMKLAETLLLVGSSPSAQDGCGDNTRAALDMVEAIPDRSVAGWKLTATLYEKLGRPKAAISAYERVLKGFPLAIAAAIAIIRLGGKAAPLAAAYRSPSFSEAWIGDLIEAHGLSALHEHRSALVRWTSLGKRFPGTFHVLVHRASAQLQLSEADAARDTFTLARRCDRNALAFMDMYAWVLRLRGKDSDLGTLTQSLLELDQYRPEPWIAVALYCDQRDERDKAIKFLDKAIALAPRHISSYLVKGFISLAMGAPDAAVQAYKHAYQIDRRELDAYTGLVESYLALPQFKDALHIAKAAAQVLPSNARALTLFASVLSRSADGQERAARMLRKALEMDPRCADAILAMSKLLILQKQFPEATELLQRHLAQHPTSDVLHTKLASVYAQNGQVEEAFKHYRTALSLTPASRSALAGLERLEASVREDNPSSIVVDADEPLDEYEFEPVY